MKKNSDTSEVGEYKIPKCNVLDKLLNNVNVLNKYVVINKRTASQIITTQ